MEHSGIASFIPIMIFLIVMPLVLLALILKVLAFWKICSRVGFHGALSLLMLVPFGDLILPLFVAFAKWPVFEQKPNQGTHAD
jgi:hypothetical protein